MENWSILGTLGSLVAAGILSTSLSSYVIGKRTNNQVAAAIVAKHDTPALRDVVGSIAIMKGAKEGEFTLELANDSRIKGTDIPLPLLLQALAADKTTPNAEKTPTIVQ